MTENITIMKQLSDLKPHKINVDIYGIENIDKDLVESIKINGILEPIVIKDDGTIISGHRRWLAAKELNIDKVLCRTTSFKSELDEEEALIEFNRQRIKNFTQLMKEADYLIDIEKQRAEQRMLAGKKIDNNPALISALGKKGETNEIVAEKLGMKKDTFKKATKIWEDAKAGKETAVEQVKKLDSKEVTVNRALTDIKREDKKVERQQDIVTNPVIPTGTYNVIYADPPWKYEFSLDSHDTVESHYPTMDINDIKNLKLPIEDNAVLLLWATAPKLIEALEVMKEWDFKYKTCAVWDKEWIGMGYWFRGQHELLLVGVKGNFKPPESDNRFSSVIRQKRIEHSKKPEIVYEMIEKMFPNKKYLEVFARNTREKWESWGNQL